MICRISALDDGCCGGCEDDEVPDRQATGRGGGQRLAALVGGCEDPDGRREVKVKSTEGTCECFNRGKNDCRML